MDWSRNIAWVTRNACENFCWKTFVGDQEGKEDVAVI